MKSIVRYESFEDGEMGMCIVENVQFKNKLSAKMYLEDFKDVSVNRVLSIEIRRE